MKWIIFILLASTIISENCRITKSQQFTEPQVGIVIDSLIIYHQDLFSARSVDAFYKMMSYQPVWSVDNQLTGTADSVITLFSHASYYGLISSDYHFKALDSLRFRQSSPAALLNLDVLLTDAFLKFAFHLQKGRLKRNSATVWKNNPDIDSASIYSLRNVITTKELIKNLEAFEPRQSEYHALKQQYLRKIQFYENALLSEDDRRILSFELTKLAINMERWREEEDFPSRYLLVNIPSFDFHLQDESKSILISKIVVGLPDKPTPTLSSSIECFVVYPYWHVPRSIATKELLPILKRNPGYLESNHFEVLNRKGNLIDQTNIEWKEYNETNFPFILRQREGQDNALGVLKFIFDNPYGVYLHDTNAKRLFSEKVRAFSHGCIRAEKAKELAMYLIDYDSGRMKPSDLEKFLSSRKKREIPLRKKLPIFVRYFTADINGIHPDIYKRDNAMLSAFEGLVEPSSNYSDTYFLRYANSENDQNLALQ